MLEILRRAEQYGDNSTAALAEQLAERAASAERDVAEEAPPMPEEEEEGVFDHEEARASLPLPRGKADLVNGGALGQQNPVGMEVDDAWASSNEALGGAEDASELEWWTAADEAEGRSSSSQKRLLATPSRQGGVTRSLLGLHDRVVPSDRAPVPEPSIEYWAVVLAIQFCHKVELFGFSEAAQSGEEGRQNATEWQRGKEETGTSQSETLHTQWGGVTRRPYWHVPSRGLDDFSHVNHGYEDMRAVGVVMLSV
eukprot:gene12739-15065_t